MVLRETHYDDEEVHPLDIPRALIVPPNKFFISTPSNKTPEETYDMLVEELQKRRTPLLVNGDMLIDQIRFVDGYISGRIAETGKADGISEKEIWIDLSGHDVRILNSSPLIEVEEPKEVYPPVFQFTCRWCGNSKTYTSLSKAKMDGWHEVTDPLGSNWWFCPNPDCDEKHTDYMELFERVR